VDGFQIEEKQNGHKKSDGNGNPRKLAGREQCYLTSKERDKPDGARIGKSVHQSGLRAGRVFSIRLSVLSCKF